MNTTNTKNKQTALGIAAAALGTAMLTVGSFALFTDSAAIKGTTTAGKLAVGITANKMTEAGDFSEQLQNGDFVDKTIQNLNPGDVRTVAYTIENKENKAMRANDTLTVTVKPNAAMMTDQSTNIDNLFAEFTEDKSAIHLVRGTKGVNGEVVTNTDEGATDYKTAVTFPDTGLSLKDAYVTEAKDAIVLVYQGDEVALDGVGLNKESIEGNADKTTSDRQYTLYFEQTAGNEWQGAEVSIDSKVTAVQYANTVAGDATLNVDTTAHTVATNAGGTRNVEMVKENVKTDDAGKANG